MKKIISMIFLALILMIVVVFPVASFADALTQADVPAAVDAVDVQPAEQNQPFTWAYLATLAGATAATLLIVQFLKVPLDKVWKIPTRVFVYLVALIILMVATAFTEGLTLTNAPLAAVNAFLVALTAYGTYEVTFARLNK